MPFNNDDYAEVVDSIETRGILNAVDKETNPILAKHRLGLWILLLLLPPFPLAAQTCREVKLEQHHKRVFNGAPMPWLEAGHHKFQWRGGKDGTMAVKIASFGREDRRFLGVQVTGPGGKLVKIRIPLEEKDQKGWEGLGCRSWNDSPALRKWTFGNWIAWSLSFEPFTNGDPPKFFIWILQPTGGSDFKVFTALGRDLVGWTFSRDGLDLVFLTQEGDGDATQIVQTFGVRQGALGLREVAPKDSSIFYVMDCPTPLQGVDAKELAGRAWTCLVWKPDSVGPRGGKAVPCALVPSSATLWQPQWINRMNKYARDRGAIASLVIPGEPLASTSPSPRSFKWAEELNLLSTPWATLDITDPTLALPLDEALRLLKDGSWGLVLKRSGSDVFAVGLAPLGPKQSNPRSE